MGFFSKIKSWFKGGSEEDEYEGMNEGGDFDISSDDGVDELLASDDSNDFMDEMNSDYDSSESESSTPNDDADFAETEQSDSEESYSDDYNEESNLSTSEEVQDNYYSNEGEESYYNESQNYDNSNFASESYTPESDYSFEADQNLTQPNEEIFMEIQNRIKMIREKTEELKRLREQNQAASQESKE